MLDDKFVPQFNVTLRCNMYNICDYCYVKEQENKVPLDFDISDFSKILDWFVMLNVDEIILLGGEPTFHPLFDELLDIIKSKKISARLFTNGTFHNNIADLVTSNEYVKTVFFHYEDNYLKTSDNIRERFLGNLEQVSKFNKKIWLRWNIDNPDVDNSELISLAKKYSASIGYSFSMPTSNANQLLIAKAYSYAESLVRLIKSAAENGIEIEPARAMPLCAFNACQLEYLKNKGNLQGSCIAINDLTVNSDLSIQLCSITHTIRTTKVTGLDDLKKKIEYLKEQELKIKSKPAIPECKECKFFGNDCQGGCYAYKLCVEEKSNSKIV
jgi:radical SAM protein with 4Fe4S-binding SPASM domain